MLVMQEAQLRIFEALALQRFEDEMVVHARQFSPRLSEVIGEAQLRVAVRGAIARARVHGFTKRGPIRLCVELMFLYGSAFDTDPQYPAIRRALGAQDDQMSRAKQIHEGHLEYLEKVCGLRAINVHKALRFLAAFARTPMEVSTENFVPDMLRELHGFFPQKAAFVGAGALRALIENGRAEARRYGLGTTRAEALVVALMYAFGHGCMSDPLYPWISQTLADPRIVDSGARASRLEKKALTWLDHVNARNEGKTSGQPPRLADELRPGDLA